MKQDNDVLSWSWFFTSETNSTFEKIELCEPREKEFVCVCVYTLYTPRVSRNWLVNIHIQILKKVGNNGI